MWRILEKFEYRNLKTGIVMHLINNGLKKTGILHVALGHGKSDTRMKSAGTS